MLGIISSICALPVLIIGYVLFAMDELNYFLFVVFLIILIIGFIVDHIIAYHFLSQIPYKNIKIYLHDYNLWLQTR